MDLSGITPDYDGDMSRFGALLGFGVGLVVAALIGGPDRDFEAEP